MTGILWKVKNFDVLTSRELYAIMKVRQEVFIIEQDCNYLDADGADEDAIHLWAEKYGRIAAYCRIFPEGIKYDETSIGRVCTSSEFRRQNLGRQMMKFALEIIASRFRTTTVRISAQDYLIKFYSEFGFKETGKKYLEDNLPHSEMLRD